jgi:hypothetical protein
MYRRYPGTGGAVKLEFTAALLRSPEALRRYSAELTGRLAGLAAAGPDQPRPGAVHGHVPGRRPGPEVAGQHA